MTTRQELQRYADSPSSRRRLRAEGEPPRESAVSMGHPPRPTDPVALLGRDLYETRSQLHELWTMVERLQAELAELRSTVEELEAASHR